MDGISGGGSLVVAITDIGTRSDTRGGDDCGAPVLSEGAPAVDVPADGAVAESGDPVTLDVTVAGVSAGAHAVSQHAMIAPAASIGVRSIRSP
ncbi:hypothetical protein [Nocardia tenerifensis]|uniref:hypothetical protein n=1 Tax=Nocardia tenerifensis TaxID=228006 RepID=UPI00146135CB|nr:hypothetical protein [Nocardia tenerifensis]